MVETTTQIQPMLTFHRPTPGQLDICVVLPESEARSALGIHLDGKHAWELTVQPEDNEEKGPAHATIKTDAQVLTIYADSATYLPALGDTNRVEHNDPELWGKLLGGLHDVLLDDAREYLDGIQTQLEILKERIDTPQLIRAFDIKPFEASVEKIAGELEQLYAKLDAMNPAPEGHDSSSPEGLSPEQGEPIPERETHPGLP